MTDIEDIVEKQGWNNDSLITLYNVFLAEKKLHAEFVTFLEAKAKEENETMEIDSNCPMCQSKNHTHVILGHLGQNKYIRCRSCGTNYIIP